MNATQLFFGLIGLFLALFGIALAKPYMTKKPTNIHTFKQTLTKLLPSHDLLVKDGTPSRIIISLDGIQKAIIIMDRPRADYVMGGLPIFTTNKLGKLTAIAHKIKSLDRTIH
ncbi:hypothetical protein [Moraxella oblonga]|uniref:hypothetical protein n=1 Tax=Moraxella oblonga TaxID=200413 RepID=UPI00082CD743|nr:hypothetical protein [Moraxella oblonga]